MGWKCAPSDARVETMPVRCPRCMGNNRQAARFCARCGLNLEAGIDGRRTAGRVAHPSPLPPPAGTQPVRDAVNLHYRVESAWGGSAWGIEGVAIVVSNGGYPLRDAVFSLSGRGADGRELLVLERNVPDLARGQDVRLEIASYEMSAPVREVVVSFVSAEFAPEQ